MSPDTLVISASSPLTLGELPPPDPILTIYGADGALILSIRQDGRVVLHQHDKVDEAARAFADGVTDLLQQRWRPVHQPAQEEGPT